MYRWTAVMIVAMILAGPAAAAQAHVAAAGGTGEAEVPETPQQRDARMAWWREARFGMFIHWGLYAVPAGTWKGKRVRGIGEWIMNSGKIPVSDYAELAKQFDPVKFDAEQWVLVAKNAGMKYIVITSKHHDGLAMFRSQASPYNIYDATPFKRDPLKELAEACRKHGMKLGFYYSQAQDWHHPGGAAMNGRWDKAQEGDMDQYMRTVAVPQVRELLSNYGPLAVLWWDTPQDMTRQRADMLRPLLRLQPGIITNDRLGGGYPGDTGTPEQFIPATGTPGRDWETCMTMNDTWGYRSDDHNWKSAQALVRNLIDIASKGGNYLLNVGPTAEGLIPQPSIERLGQVGQWMQANGQAIYGTTASPFRYLPWGRCTRKGDTLYLHVFDWPKDGRLLVPMTSRLSKAYLLGESSKALAMDATEQGAVLHLPPAAPDAIASVVVAETAEPVQVIKPVLTARADGSIVLLAPDAEITGSTARLEGAEQTNIGWWTDAGDYVSWSPVQIAKAGEFEVTVTYACEPTTPGSEYAVQVGDQSLTGKVKATKGWGDYRTVKLGTLRIATEGKVTVALKPMKMPGFAVMNLRSVVLSPR